MTKIAFLMDPIESISVKKDSTLAMIRAAQNRDLDVYFLQQEDLFLDGGVVKALLSPIRLRRDFAENLDYRQLSPEAVRNCDWAEIGEAQRQPLANMDIIMMRKDPPFDMEYIYTTYLLERVQAEGALVVNRPESLRDCNEKLFATQFPQFCPNLIVSRNMELLREFHLKHGNVVFKKLDGMGGASIFRVMQDDPNLSVVIETLTRGGQEQVMGQVYLPQIVDGDKRILLINGEPIPYALARIPSAGETRGNLAAGGHGEGRRLTDRDLWIAEQVGPELARRGLYFVGIDVIGDYLTEINVTCPTCIRELDEQFDLDIAGQLMDSLMDGRQRH